MYMTYPVNAHLCADLCISFDLTLLYCIMAGMMALPHSKAQDNYRLCISTCSLNVHIYGFFGFLPPP